jgi:hypothetical protein
MISDKVHKLCNATDTVSSEMAKDPTLAPGDVYKKLYGHFDTDKSTEKERDHKGEISEADLKRAEECGNWGPTKPSKLFLRVCTASWGQRTLIRFLFQMFHDALCTLDKTVEGAVISPPLMGRY